MLRSALPLTVLTACATLLAPGVATAAPTRTTYAVSHMPNRAEIACTSGPGRSITCKVKDLDPVRQTRVTLQYTNGPLSRCEDRANLTDAARPASGVWKLRVPRGVAHWTFRVHTHKPQLFPSRWGACRTLDVLK